MIRGIRDVRRALGSGVKEPTVSERKNIPISRRSLVAACDIQAGEKFSAENLTVKRPGNGVSPRLYWEWLGKVAQRDYRKDEVILP
jgi:N-acetylneuraminate synthase